MAVQEREYRRMEYRDIEAVEELCREALKPDRLPLVYDRSKVLSLLEHFCRSCSDYHEIATEGATPVAGVFIAIRPSLFFERNDATVMMFYSKSAGAGRELMLRAKERIDADMMIRRLTWPMEFDASPALIRFARMVGFNMLCASATYLKV